MAVAATTPMLPRPVVDGAAPARPTVLVDATPLQTAHRFRGVGRYVAHLIDAFAADPVGPHVEVLSLAGHGAPAPVAATVRRPSRPRYRVPNLWPELLYPHALAHTSPDVYHSTDSHVLVTHPTAPTVVTLHDLIPLAFRERYLGSWRKSDIRLAHALYRRRLARADRVICVSEETRRDAVTHLDVHEDRLVVVPLASEPADFYPETPERVAAARRAHQVDRPYLLYVGTLEPHKNVERLLAAFRAARARLGGEPLLVVVGRWNRGAEQRFAAMLDEAGLTGWATHVGYVPLAELRALYAGASALVFPSLKEGFGLPVLEAMMSGAPVVCSDIRSLSDIAGDAAAYFDPYSVESMTETIVATYSDGDHLRLAGPVRARRFSWAATATQTLEVYRSVL